MSIRQGRYSIVIGFSPMHLPSGSPHLLFGKGKFQFVYPQAVGDQGSGFDIVSGGELLRILEVNKKAARRVVFSGVGKTAEEIDLALAAGILIFNVESESEVALLAERAASGASGPGSPCG
jgi:hypothetical protein